MGKARRNAEKIAEAAALPQRQQVRRERREAKRSTASGQKANRQQYKALDRSLSKIGKDYRQDYATLGSQLNTGLGGLSSMLNVGSNPAAMAAMGSTVGSGLSALAQQRQRGVEYTASARRQGAIERKTNALNIVDAFHNHLKTLQDRLRDIADQQSANTQALIPDLQDRYYERRQMQEAEAEDNEFQNWLQNWFQNMYGPNPAAKDYNGSQVTPTMVPYAPGQAQYGPWAGGYGYAPVAQTPPAPPPRRGYLGVGAF